MLDAEGPADRNRSVKNSWTGWLGIRCRLATDCIGSPTHARSHHNPTHRVAAHGGVDDTHGTAPRYPSVLEDVARGSFNFGNRYL